jgi:hypothetical protein
VDPEAGLEFMVCKKCLGTEEAVVWPTSATLSSQVLKILYSMTDACGEGKCSAQIRKFLVI